MQSARMGPRRAARGSRPASAADPAIRVVLLPRDTNPHGSIFGGVILSHLDLAGAVALRRRFRRTVVTVCMREVVFKQPVYVGDTVSFYARIARVGRTSATVRIKVEAERDGDPGRRVRVTEAEVVYVAVDHKGTPVPLIE